MQVDRLVPGTKRHNARIVFADVRPRTIGSESVSGHAVANKNLRGARARELLNGLHGPFHQRRTVGNIGRLVREAA